MPRLVLAGILSLCPVALNFGPQKMVAWLKIAAHPADPAADGARQQALIRTIEEKFLQKDSKIDWPCFADIVEHVAQASGNDEDFRRDLWALFGNRGVLVKRMDPENTGLPRELHNTGYTAEQQHHYLGGVTGADWQIPTHLFNTPICSYLNELKEYYYRKDASRPFNQGDIRLFDSAQKHRDDFLTHGRHTVAANIRKLLQRAGEDDLQPPTDRLMATSELNH